MTNDPTSIAKSDAEDVRDLCAMHVEPDNDGHAGFSATSWDASDSAFTTGRTAPHHMPSFPDLSELGEHLAERPPASRERREPNRLPALPASSSRAPRAI